MRRSIPASRTPAVPVEPCDNPDTHFDASVMETRPPPASLCFVLLCCFSLRANFLDAHLAELLSTARRWRDLIATGNAASPAELAAQDAAKKSGPRGPPFFAWMLRTQRRPNIPPIMPPNSSPPPA